MFKRRVPKPVHHQLGHMIWPRTGWARAIIYLWHRIGRMRGTPHSIAAGFAAGAAVSFTPFIGLHFVLAGITALLTRGNIIAAMIGTGVGNPWTFPFIWVWIYKLGHRFTGIGSTPRVDPDFLSLFTDLPGFLIKALVSFKVDPVYFDNIWSVWWPMFVGSVPTFVLVWLASYLALKPLLAAYQAQRVARRSRKRKREREARDHPVESGAAVAAHPGLSMKQEGER